VPSNLNPTQAADLLKTLASPRSQEEFILKTADPCSDELESWTQPERVKDARRERERDSPDSRSASVEPKTGKRQKPVPLPHSRLEPNQPNAKSKMPPDFSYGSVREKPTEGTRYRIHRIPKFAVFKNYGSWLAFIGGKHGR
jgi:hypothetical protein